MDDTRTALFSQFREEVDTHLLRLSQGVVAIEQDPHNADLLKEIFRAAHTIKGAAKLMGFEPIVRVTHEMESVLGDMREGRLQLTSDISDLLFEGIDAITALIQVQANPQDAQAQEALAALDLDGIQRRLRALAPPATPDPEPDAAPLPAPPAPANGMAAGPSRPEQHLGRPDITSLKLGDDSIRVRVQKLDALMHLSGEMVITKMQHQTIGDVLHTLVDAERQRTSRLSLLVDRVQSAWQSVTQADMEDALREIRALTGHIDERTLLTQRQFQDYANRLNTIADELENTVRSVRMLPVETLFSTFPRAVRDFKRETGKEVALRLEGADTEIDKQILEALSDPLIHLLRNALDHGIESPAARAAAGKPVTGQVEVRAYQQGTQVVIEVRDDGAGIYPATLRHAAVQKKLISRAEADALTDAEALQLIFLPGFSTATIITDVSGRGVGMDVVKSTVEGRLNGTVGVESVPGAGTRISLRLPLTLVTMKALLVRVGTEVFVLPSHTVEGGMDYVGADDIMMAENREAVRLQGRIVPLVRLADLLNLERLASGTWLRDAGLSRLDTAGRGGADGVGEPESDLAALLPPPLPGTGVRLQNKLPGVVVGQGDRQTCFLVDELIDELDVVVKSLGPLLTRVDTAMGATILGNGRVVIILDVPSLLLEARSRSMRGAAPPTWPVHAEVRRPRILVVDDSITTRELEKSILENAGFDVDVAMDGCEALEKLEEQRRGEDRLYDLVIADIEMPRMDGLELTQRVKSHGDAGLRALPMIIVSSLASDTYKQRGIEVGAQAYITKGQFDQGHLLATINLLIH